LSKRKRSFLLKEEAPSSSEEKPEGSLKKSLKKKEWDAWLNSASSLELAKRSNSPNLPQMTMFIFNITQVSSSRSGVFCSIHFIYFKLYNK